MKLLTEIFSLGLIYCLEQLHPFFLSRTGRAAHAVRNLSMGLINAAVTQILFAALLLAVARAADEGNLGVLRWLGFPDMLNGLLIFILFDAWMYLWHRANHEIPFLWKFHRTHHTDRELDSTSAFRFHAGEICLSHLARLLIIPLLGVSPTQLLWYETLLQPIIIFHHSNLAFPKKWDEVLRKLIVSPNMHRVHHSKVISETNSNYSSIFSFWDRLGKSFKQREDLRAVAFGLPEFNDESCQTVEGMLFTPFRKK